MAGKAFLKGSFTFICITTAPNISRAIPVAAGPVKGGIHMPATKSPARHSFSPPHHDHEPDWQAVGFELISQGLGFPATPPGIFTKTQNPYVDNSQSDDDLKDDFDQVHVDSFLENACWKSFDL